MNKTKLKIAFLDAATVDLGDLDMNPLRRAGTLVCVPRCPKNRIPQRLRNAQVVITNKVVLDRKELSRFSNLKLICVAATGVNNIDLVAARELGIGVCNVAGYSTTTVVEHTLMFLLAFAHRLGEHHGSVWSGKWSRSPFFTLLDHAFSDLEGKIIGILGWGNIGKRVGRLARALGMKVLVGKIPGRKYASSPKRFPLDTLLQRSDFVSLHCPLSPQTLNLISRDRLKKMKKGAYLINMARGPIVVEADVVHALKKNWLAGYGSDVTVTEPIPKAHPFLQRSLKHKILLTPHVAWASRESRQRLVDEIGKNIGAFRRGKKRNRIV